MTSGVYCFGSLRDEGYISTEQTGDLVKWKFHQGDIAVDKIETLTAAERLQLVNQLAILEKLDPHNAKDYAKDREILQHGYTILYGQVFQTIFEEVGMEQCRYVFDVLDMHRVMIKSYAELKDKGGIKPDDIKFRGFDGNHESELHAFAAYLHKMGNFEETLTGRLDSHSASTMTRYPMMLSKWKKIKEAKGMDGWELTAEEIKAIISLDRTR